MEGCETKRNKKIATNKNIYWNRSVKISIHPYLRSVELLCILAHDTEDIILRMNLVQDQDFPPENVLQSSDRLSGSLFGAHSNRCQHAGVIMSVRNLIRKRR